MKEALLRQSFLGDESDAVLDSTVVAVIGLGGGGSHVVQQLSHIGIGSLILVDPDRVELTNLNRLVDATYEDARRRRFKTAIAARQARSVNPGVQLTIRSAPWRDTLPELRDADIIVGCLDSYSERSQLEAFARRYLIPYIDIGMGVHHVGDHFVVSGQVARSMPGGLCLQCMGIITQDDVAKEAYGVAGGRPQVVWPNGLLASAAVGLLVELVTPWFKSSRGSEFLTYDGNTPSLTRHHWMNAVANRTCPHYPLEDVGDPHAFWIASQDGELQAPSTTHLATVIRKLRSCFRLYRWYGVPQV